MTRYASSRPRRTALAVVATMAAAFGVLAVAPSAFAVTHHPKGEYAPFAECPFSNSAVEDCVVASTESGAIDIGKEDVPISKVITLQGGIVGFLHGSEEAFVGAENGNTLTKSPQKVPGGLSGLVKCNEISNFLERIACEVVFENGATGVYATTELAAPASSVKLNSVALLEAEGTALSLPIKVRLENSLLGSSCYIGSNSHPIVIELTTGTTSPPAPNKPITGSPGEATGNEAGTILTLNHNSLVNNSYSAPGAEGCGGLFSFLIDPIVDSRLSLPSAAGHNTAILNGTLKVAVAEAVKDSE
jgi:hypothetical protein